MENLDIILILMTVLGALYTVADKLGISYPIFLVLAGLVIGLIPGLPVVHLDPEVVFLIFLPPLLFDAARNMSWHDFRKNAGPIGRLAIGLVFFTTASVAVCAYYLLPGFSWPLAFALGAIVSPPDAVAATAVTKTLHLPKQLVAILEGESLINDASALTAYRYAVAAVLSGSFVFWDASMEFSLVFAGGVAIGFLVASVFLLLQKRFLNNPSVETMMTLVVPYASYLIAEHNGASGVLSVVTAGLFVSWRAHELFTFQTRMKMNNFWDTLIFLLNGFVFVLIGLQLPDILDDVKKYSLHDMILYGLVISIVTILARIIWIFPSVYVSNFFACLFRKGHIGLRERSRELIVLSWAGMRGVVSLASALALPLTLDNGADFPQRSMILFITFMVILVTLVFQGLTLPSLIRFLKLEEPKDESIREEKKARLKMARSTMEFIREKFPQEKNEQIHAELKRKFERQIDYLDGVLETQKQETHIPWSVVFQDYLRAEQEVIRHQRKMLQEMHRNDAISAESLRNIEQELDLWSMTLLGKIRPR